MSLLMGTIKNKVGLYRQFRNMSLTELEFKVEEDYMMEDIDEDERMINSPALGQTTKKRARGKESLADCVVDMMEAKKEKIDQDLSKTETSVAALRDMSVVALTDTSVVSLTKSPGVALTKSPGVALTKSPGVALTKSPALKSPGVAVSKTYYVDELKVTLVEGVREISVVGVRKTSAANVKETPMQDVKENSEDSLTEQTVEDMKKKTVECVPPFPVTNSTTEETMADDGSDEDNQGNDKNTFLLSRLGLMLGETCSVMSVEDVLTVLEEVYKEERITVVGKDNFISTPLHALKHMAGRFEETIHNEVFYLNKEELPKPLVRVELIVGAFRGVGEAFYKRMAAQLAAIDVLMRVENVSVIDFVVPYAIFPGWRIRPQVCVDLMMFCKKNGLKMPRYMLKTNPSNPEKPSCLVEVLIGPEVIAVGESDLAYVARRLAACNAIERLTDEIYPLEYAAFGTACSSYGELVESGHVPVISEAKKRWLLDENAQGASDSARGMDLIELDALERQLYIEEMNEVTSKKREVKITLSNDVNNKIERKVYVRQ